MKQTEVIRGLLLPPREDAAEAVHPTVCPFHHPPACPEGGLSLDGLGFLAASPDMRGVTKLIRQCSGFLVVVPLVQAHALWAVPRWRRTLDRDAFQGRLHHLEVVAIGSVNFPTHPH